MIRRNICSGNEVEQYVHEKFRVPGLWTRVMWTLGQQFNGSWSWSTLISSNTSISYTDRGRRLRWLWLVDVRRRSQPCTSTSRRRIFVRCESPDCLSLQHTQKRHVFHGLVSISIDYVDIQVFSASTIRYDTIRYNSVYLMCSKKLTGSQLSLPHVVKTNKRSK